MFWRFRECGAFRSNKFISIQLVPILHQFPFPPCTHRQTRSIHRQEKSHHHTRMSHRFLDNTPQPTAHPEWAIQILRKPCSSVRTKVERIADRSHLCLWSFVAARYQLHGDTNAITHMTKHASLPSSAVNRASTVAGQCPPIAEHRRGGGSLSVRSIILFIHLHASILSLSTRDTRFGTHRTEKGRWENDKRNRSHREPERISVTSS